MLAGCVYPLYMAVSRLKVSESENQARTKPLPTVKREGTHPGQEPRRSPLSDIYDINLSMRKVSANSETGVESGPLWAPDGLF